MVYFQLLAIRNKAAKNISLVKLLKVTWVGHMIDGWVTFPLKNFFFSNVYLFFERQIESQSLSREGADREGDTESEADSRL